jgi:hypothetical protein
MDLLVNYVPNARSHWYELSHNELGNRREGQGYGPRAGYRT